jgi:hypothetical protein
LKPLRVDEHERWKIGSLQFVLPENTSNSFYEESLLIFLNGHRKGMTRDYFNQLPPRVLGKYSQSGYAVIQAPQ